MNDQLLIERPSRSEYHDFYAGYIATLPDDANVLTVMAQQHDDLQKTLRALSDEQGLFRYLPGKWSIKQVLGHMIDAERVFAYRVLRISRGDTTPLPGFDQEPYVENGNFEFCEMSDLLDEFATLRTANLAMFRRLGPEELKRKGTASGAEVTVRALLFIIAGHERHHLKILQDKYLPNLPENAC